MKNEKFKVADLVRNNIKALKPYSSARGSYSSGILLDANENAFGSVVKSMTGLNRYPDPNQGLIREKLSEFLKFPKENLIFGVGSDEIIDQIIRIFAEPGKDKAIICEPTYGMYSVACNINNVGIINSYLTNDFQLDVDDIKSKDDENVKLVFVCSPNNPTANLINRKDIENLCSSLNAVVVVDEAYIDFSEENSAIDLVLQYPNIIITRTFSKAWGMAAVRAGFAIADKTVIDYFFKIKAPYNVSKPTEKLILEALNNLEERENFIAEIINEKDFIISELGKIPQVIDILKSNANFLIFKIENATIVYQKLIEKGVIIRNRSNLPLLENSLRLTIGTREENQTFLKELKSLYE